MDIDIYSPSLYIAISDNAADALAVVESIKESLFDEVGHNIERGLPQLTNIVILCNEAIRSLRSKSSTNYDLVFIQDVIKQSASASYKDFAATLSKCNHAQVKFRDARRLIVDTLSDKERDYAEKVCDREDLELNLKILINQVDTKTNEIMYTTTVLQDSENIVKAASERDSKTTIIRNAAVIGGTVLTAIGAAAVGAATTIVVAPVAVPVGSAAAVIGFASMITGATKLAKSAANATEEKKQALEFNKDVHAQIKEEGNELNTIFSMHEEQELNIQKLDNEMKSLQATIESLDSANEHLNKLSTWLNDTLVHVTTLESRIKVLDRTTQLVYTYRILYTFLLGIEDQLSKLNSLSLLNKCTNFVIFSDEMKMLGNLQNTVCLSDQRIGQINM